VGLADEKVERHKVMELSGFYNMDCMDGMREIPDKFFELAIVDPPYGIGGKRLSQGGDFKNKNGTKRKINLHLMDSSWDVPPPPEYFKELFRTSKNQIIWGGNYFNLPPTRCVLCWDKEQPWENFSQWEMAWTSYDKPAGIFRHGNTIKECGKIHPTQKPVALYKWLLTNYAAKGDKILDTHVGSGSSLIACYELGFDYMGFEIDPDYYAAATKRIEAVKAQGRLFEP
jgi:site-specific DNA-methyltransferase (adenine-specific)